MDYGKWTFNKYVDPPSIGAGGKIELKLTINVHTGEVINAQPVSGERGLGEFVAGIADEWVFSPLQDLPDTITAIIDYSIGCQVIH